MASASINITLNSNFGSRGTGNNQFDFPTGICVANGYLYIVDKQNHRIKKHDLTGIFVSEFGSVGSGNNEFYFPEDICTDGTYLYITDSANHRIKRHDLNGVFVSEYGTRGTGNNQFEYPVGITTDNTYLYVADKGNSRVMKSTISGAYVSKYGIYGSGLGKLNFAEGVTIFDGGKLAIADSANNRVVILRASDFLYLTEFGSFDYVSRINDTNGVLSVTDRQASKVYFYDYDGNEIENYSTSLFFPESIVYTSNKVFLVDSANHNIKIFDFEVSTTSSFYLTKLVSLTRQLYPTGRAWRMKKAGVFYNLHEALAFSEANAYQKAIDQLNVILPDNDNFSVDDAARWEQSLGMYVNPLISLSDRKEAIIRKINHPGNIYGRQSKDYIQGELQKAGFDVYVHENKVGVNPAYTQYDPVTPKYGNIIYGQSTYGNVGLAYTLIANYIDETKDTPYTWGSEGLKQSFFIGGSVFGTSANIDILRKNEFRELILKLKPAQTFGFLLINYI